MKRKIATTIGSVLLAVILLSVQVFAATPMEAYTHQTSVNGERKVVYSRDIYDVKEQITGSSLGLKGLTGLTDIYCAKDGMIYVLCGDDSRLLVLNKNYELKEEIVLRAENGKEINYDGAQGIFIDDDGTIYVADTLNSRVLLLDSDGVMVEELTTPVADVIPQDFFFQPTKVIRDKEGYTYVLSMGCYNGILLYSDEYEFLGFYGASEVESSILDTLSYLWELLTSNDEKKAKQTKTLPYTAIDIAMDEEGFIYTCTGTGNNTEVGEGQIRRISPGGSNVLRKRELDGTASSSSSYNFFEEELTERLGVPRGQQVQAIDVSASQNMYLLDATYGKVYMYDQDLTLLTVFGGGNGTASTLGTFGAATTLAVNGNDVLVADAKNNSITVFELTEFGTIFLQASELFYESKYVEAKPYWEKIVAQDANNVLAYTGLARACYAENDMEGALKYSKMSLDYVTYDQVHQERISAFITNHFALLFALVIFLIAGIVILLIKIRKRKTPMIANEKLRCFVSSLFHPFQAFYDVKYKKQGSLKIAVSVTVGFILSEILKDTCCGFLFHTSDAQSYNVLFTLAKTGGLLVVWTIINWATCTIMNGKGRLKEIYIVSSYAMTPMVIYNVLYLLLSHVMYLDGVDALTSIQIVVLAYVFFILCIGLMTIHEYDFPKFMLTSIVTVLFMILIVFIAFTLVILLQQFWNFLYSIFMEVMYR